MAAVGLILVCVAAAWHPLSAASSDDTALQALVQWIRDSGGEINAAIVTLPQGGRGIIAPRDFKQGDVLAKVPLDNSYTLSGPQETWAAKLWQDMQDPTSPHAPHFRTMPARDEVWSFYDIPDSYLPLIQSPQQAMEGRIQALRKWYLPQPATGDYDNGDPAYEAARYVRTLMATRRHAHHSEPDWGMLIAFLDMANYDHPCTTTQHITDNCEWKPNTTTSPDAPPRKCTFWLATSDIAAGTELCTSYRYLTSDMALLQYGFLVGVTAAQQLTRFDRHDFDPSDPWGEPWRVAGYEEPTPFTPGNAMLAAAELTRLAQLHEQLTVRDAELASSPVQPHPRDTDGRFLSMMLTWRAQRKQAVRLEMVRLLEVAADLDKQEAQLTGSLAEL